MIFTTDGGDRYCIAFGGLADGAVMNSPSTSTRNKVFRIVTTVLAPTHEAGCPTP